MERFCTVACHRWSWPDLHMPLAHHTFLSVLGLITMLPRQALAL